MTDLQAFNNVTSGPWITIGDDIQYRIEADDSTTRLYFQCSKSARDWINNFNFPAAPYKDMPVKWYAHRGFIRAWKSCQDVIMAKLSGDKYLEVYGYSHGGPLACFALEDYLYRDKTRQGHALVFGSPRFLWLPGSIKNRFSEVVNFQSCGDIVTHLPPAIFGYQHIGVIIKAGKSRFIPLPKYHEADYYRSILA